ncbi:hypothetical protein BCR44DRAFT_1101216 [Catenaria anguillulae PL171]|uniref:Uncharacterized protein n=1 Tax=Catenaria anguillulae PL171 TaxID=765915 RepID=A0A1Y2I4E1_9FUNG|nr:hypothetical protein BCR44DRAFT_1101216 [Catenaria anguillulae PL171]
MHGYVMHPLAAELCDSHGVPHWPPRGQDPKHAIGDEPSWAAFCIHSPAMLARPKDWPANHDTIGFMHAPLHDPLPLDLAAFIKAAKVDQVPLAFIGLGSALWVGFDSKEDSQVALQALYDGAVHASRDLAADGFRVILQTVTTPAGDYLTPTLGPAAKDLVFVLSQSASHDMIFPHCAVVASHGGVGTLQTTLLHGAVPVIFPCIPTGDEPFWASFVQYRGLGVHGGPALTMHAESVSKAFKAAFAGLEAFREKVEEVRRGMARERPVDRVLAWIEAE